MQTGTYVTSTPTNYCLAGPEHTPAIYLDPEALPGVVRAARDLAEDICAVTGVKPQFVQDFAAATVVIATVGHSGYVATDAAAKLAGKWESFRLSVSDGRLYIVGSDKRGTIFGIYDLSQKIGVSPWHWWADVPTKHCNAVYLDLTAPYFENEPGVKYRGIFLNDEECFHEWNAHRGDPNHVESYKRIYELLLRLKANTFWPAMHDISPCFHTDPQNAANADYYGIVVGTSHCEQMLRNNIHEYEPFEAKWTAAHPDKPIYKMQLPDSRGPCGYIWLDADPETGARVYNKELLLDYWTEGVQQFGKYECIFTMGMRGIHDAGWKPPKATTLEEKAARMQEIVTAQRAMLEKALQKPAAEIPQLLIPYKEVQEIYDAGMQVPDDMMLMWTDDNFGYLRQHQSAAERKRSGGSGIYYHVSYHGSPNSYVWLSTTTPLALIREEMGKAYDMDERSIWILNVGDLKPAEIPTEYFLDLARRPDAVRKQPVRAWLAEKAARDFGFDGPCADEFADILTEFHRLAFACKPDHFRPELFGCDICDDEAGRYLAAFDALLERAETLRQAVPKEGRAAYFELLGYPLRAAAAVARRFLSADCSRLYAAQGRGAVVNKLAAESTQAYYELAQITAEYNALCDGKWCGIMDPFQPHLQGFHAVQPNLLPCGNVTNLPFADLKLYPQQPMAFDARSQNTCYLDVCNIGAGRVEWALTAEKPWVQFSQNHGVTIDQQRVTVSLDWAQVPAGHSAAAITAQYTDAYGVQRQQQCSLAVFKEETALPQGTYAAANDIVSIPAACPTLLTPGPNGHWEKEDDLGHFGASLKLWPNDAPAVEQPTPGTAAIASYTFYLPERTAFAVELYRIPTLNQRGKMRVGLALEGGSPVVLEGTNAFFNNSQGDDPWGKGVMRNYEVLRTEFNSQMPGLHTLNLYQIDPGFVLEKIVVYTERAAQDHGRLGPVETPLITE